MIRLKAITDKEIRLISAEYWILLPIDFVRDMYWKIRYAFNFPSQFDYFCQYIENTLRDRLKGDPDLQKYIIMGERLYSKNHKRITRSNLLKVFSEDCSLVTTVTMDLISEYYHNKPQKNESILYFKESDLENIFNNHGLSMNLILLTTYFLKDKLGLQTQEQEVI